MRTKLPASAVLAQAFLWVVCLGGCSRTPSSKITLNQEQARLQALLDGSVFTLKRDGAELHVVTTACFTRPAMTLTTDFRLQLGQTFTSEPDHHINTSFELADLGSDYARFKYVHHSAPPSPSSVHSEDRGEIVLDYRQRPLFFPEIADARAATSDALRRYKAPLAELDVDRAIPYPDRSSCTRWNVRIPGRASAALSTQPATARGVWIVRLDMATGESTANAEN